MKLREIVAMLSSAAFAALALANGNEPAARTADKLSPTLLAECDAGAAPFGRYDAPIAAAAQALIEIGAVRRDVFSDARIGFCALQAAGGPVAATSCGDGVILLDAKYIDAKEALNLKATLAHEMVHHSQHLAAKAQAGEAYCDSARYSNDKPGFEAAADAFGEKVAALFLTGRGIEVVNACESAISLYLEADDPVAVRTGAAAFEHVGPHSRHLLGERARSGAVRFYARTNPASGTVHVWQDAESAETRFVEGRLARLKRMRLTAPEGLEAPFRLRLQCRAPAR